MINLRFYNILLFDSKQNHLIEKLFQNRLATMPKEEVEIKIARDVSASIKRSFQAVTSSLASNNVDSNTQVGLE